MLFPRHMRWIPVVALLLALPAPAAATSCYFGPFVTSGPSTRCEVVVWAYAGYSPEEGPEVQVHRDGQWIDVGGELTTEQQMLSVAYPERDCEGNVTNTTYQSQLFDIYRVKLEGAQVGDELYVAGMFQGTLADVACSDASPPDVTCGVTQFPCDPAEPPSPPEDADLFDGGGCHTSGNSCGGAAAFLLVALAAWRRRRGVRAA